MIHTESAVAEWRGRNAVDDCRAVLGPAGWQTWRLESRSHSVTRDPDTLIATLENSLTAAERNMIALGEHQRVRETRTLLSSEVFYFEPVASPEAINGG